LLSKPGDASKKAQYLMLLFRDAPLQSNIFIISLKYKLLSTRVFFAHHHATFTHGDKRLY